MLDEKTRKPVAASMTIISTYQNWNWSRCWKMAIQPDRSYNTDWNQPSNVNHRCVIRVINFLCSPFLGCLSQFFLWSESFVYAESFSMHFWNFYQFFSKFEGDVILDAVWLTSRFWSFPLRVCVVKLKNRQGKNLTSFFSLRNHAVLTLVIQAIKNN